MTRSAEKHHYGRLSKKRQWEGGEGDSEEGSTLTLRPEHTGTTQLEPKWMSSSTETDELPVHFTIVIITHSPLFYTTPVIR